MPFTLEPPMILQCYRCGHKWLPRFSINPVKCPRCQSKRWSLPRPEPDAYLPSEVERRIERLFDRILDVLAQRSLERKAIALTTPTEAGKEGENQWPSPPHKN